MEKIWITGAKGHVGTALSALLDCREYEIFPTDVDEVDVTDLEAVNNYARVNRPDIIINCVGYSDVAGCETNPEEAFAVNAVGTRNIAVMAQSIGAKLIHRFRVWRDFYVLVKHDHHAAYQKQQLFT